MPQLKDSCKGELQRKEGKKQKVCVWGREVENDGARVERRGAGFTGQKGQSLQERRDVH